MAQHVTHKETPEGRAQTRNRRIRRAEKYATHALAV